MYVTIITSWISYEYYWYLPIIMPQVFFWTKMYEQDQEYLSTCRYVWLPTKTVELHTSKQLPPAGKEYFCFQINSKSPHAAQYVTSRILNKAVYFILYIDTFEKNELRLNVCYNHHVLKIIWRLLIFTNHYSPGLLMNTNLWTT